MRKLLVLCLISFQSLLLGIDWDVQAESPHAQLFCMEKDRSVADELLDAFEKAYAQFTVDFHHAFSQKIAIEVFPDLNSLHHAIGFDSAPDWVIVSSDSKSIAMVSPLNPGPYHTRENVVKGLSKRLVCTFIENKFGKGCVPYWVFAGVSAKKANWPHTKLPEQLPSWEELDNADCEKCAEMGWGGVALSLISFIEKKYGWEILLEVLEHYKDIEKILGITTEELMKEWKHFVSQKS